MYKIIYTNTATNISYQEYGFSKYMKNDVRKK